MKNFLKKHTGTISSMVFWATVIGSIVYIAKKATKNIPVIVEQGENWVVIKNSGAKVDKGLLAACVEAAKENAKMNPGEQTYIWIDPPKRITE